jgi:hypothetical protein
MATSRDRVRFVIPSHRYFSARYGCPDKAPKGKAAYCAYMDMVLETLGIRGEEFNAAEAYHCGVKGVEILCRPSQFGRFMVRRNELGLENWSSELNAKLEQAKFECDPCSVVALAADLDTCAVTRVFRALGLTRRQVRELLDGQASTPFIDVSGRH